ncbi:MAG: hypothetical protein HKL88_07205 [Bacteroidia bacterium]|nr:hypothetical protein [Bacteroidia bacterium]
MAEEYKKPAYDSWKLGVSLGIIAPIATFLSYYFYSSRRIPFARFVDNLRLGEVFLPLISLCVVPNLLIFFIFIWTKKDTSAKGVILATILYALYVAVMKVI